MARVLLIDDDAEAREVTRLILQSAGHAVRELPNGRKAESTARSWPADVVVTDLVMPEREGIETIRALQETMPELPIIAISGGGRYASGEEYLKHAKLFGAVTTLTKPIHAADLRAAVRQATAH